MCVFVNKLTEHDFICSDNGVELEGIGNDFTLAVSIVEIILVDETTTVRTVGGTHTHTLHHMCVVLARHE